MTQDTMLHPLEQEEKLTRVKSEAELFTTRAARSHEGSLKSSQKWKAQLTALQQENFAFFQTLLKVFGH